MEKSWWAARVSNPRPPACQAGALPTELAALRLRRNLLDQSDPLRSRGSHWGSSGRLIVGAMPPYIGRRMRRVEDERLITGRGRFAGDIQLEGLAHVAFSRSTLPHARINSIDSSAASAMPGVLAVWTAADLPETAEGLSEDRKS